MLRRIRAIRPTARARNPECGGVSNMGSNTRKYLVGSLAIAAATGGALFLALGSGGAPASGAQQPRNSLLVHANAVLKKDGLARSTAASQAACDGPGESLALTYAGGQTPTMFGNYDSTVGALDAWYFNQSAAGPGDSGTNFDAVSNLNQAAAACYFTGAYGYMPHGIPGSQPSSSAFILIFVTNGTAYLAGSGPYPVPQVWQTPPA
jgi:hypothetical protein